MTVDSCHISFKTGIDRTKGSSVTDQQWDTLQRVVRGEAVDPLPVGFIIDSPWLPGWYGTRLVEYFSNDELWLQANLKAVNEFPDVLFLPGFWSEYGMCTEPSAFGARCTFPPDEFPHAHPVIRSAEEIDSLPLPDPARDGLLPFALNRLRLAKPKIEAAGHRIRFAVSRGPLNIASYLMGMTEFLTLLLTEPEAAGSLLNKVTTFVKEWLRLQREAFPSIDGILLLDDVIGFMGEREFRRFGLPCLKELYDAEVSVRFLHNDAACKVSAPLLAEVGVNMFNMGFGVSLNELKQWTGGKVTLLGNIPPRDVLASGSPDDVARVTSELVSSLKDRSRIIMSCGGGMPPGVASVNLRAFVDTVRSMRSNI
jgi:uroporphyrinogen-III decarboxylase